MGCVVFVGLSGTDRIVARRHKQGAADLGRSWLLEHLLDQSSRTGVCLLSKGSSQSGTDALDLPWWVEEG